LGSWSKLIALSSREKQLLAASLIVMPINGLALRLMSLSRWQSVLSRLTPIDRARGEARAGSLFDLANQTARLVLVAATRGPYRGNCLQQSLTIWWLLRRQRIHSDIRFGARRFREKFEAHAWVEVEGIALNQRSNSHFGFEPFEPAVVNVEPNP
jgi:hypothetical protein